MAITTRLMRGVTPRQVFDVLRDGRSYQHWVVGTRAVRAVDPGWPAPGSRIHYTVGYGLLRKDDVTSALAYEPDARLELEAHAWPVGTAGIVLTAEAAQEGTRFAIDEAPRRGIARLVHNPLAAALIALRNVETLRRLEAQARLR
jgi:hypothetical protein